jgi:hypothetical protein
LQIVAISNFSVHLKLPHECSKVRLFLTAELEPHDQVEEFNRILERIYSLYYKCTNRINKGNRVCSSGNIPMEMLDELILKAMSGKVFTPTRVAAMLKELQDRLNESQSHNDRHLQSLKKELDDLKNRMDRLCDAIENGILPVRVTTENGL